MGALTVGVLLLGTGGGVCWSAILNITEILFSTNIVPIEESAQRLIELICSNPLEKLWSLRSEEILSAAGISVTAVSIVSKEALFRYTL